MNKPEAQMVLDERLEEFRFYSHAELTTWIKNEHVEAEEAIATSGMRYELEFSAAWADQARGVIKILGRIDEGDWRHPLSGEKWIQVDPTADWGLPEKKIF